VTPDGGSPPFDVVVVGASQAGLAVGAHLARRGLTFVIVDGGSEIGEVWSSRWDSLTLFTPAQYSGLPGMAFPAAPDVYPTKSEVAAYLRSYAATFDLPVRLNARVTSVERDGDGYVLNAGNEVVEHSVEERGILHVKAQFGSTALRKGWPSSAAEGAVSRVSLRRSVRLGGGA
jgi:cation diffusion facilitator CzcD-associated flavoprotein CzcO